jgi:hypothetical protein
MLITSTQGLLNRKLALLSPLVLQPVEEFPEEYDDSLPPLGERDNFAQRFMEGVANIRLDVKVEGEDHIFGVWLRHIIIAESKAAFFREEFSISVVLDEYQPSDTPREITVIAKVGFEIIPEGTRRAGNWVSFAGALTGGVRPPARWRTGNRFVDTKVFQAKNAHQIVNDGIYGIDDAQRNALNLFAADFRRLASVTVYPDGVSTTFNAALNYRLKLTDIIVGPFNHR